MHRRSTAIFALLAATFTTAACSSAPVTSDGTSGESVDIDDGLDDPALYWVNKERCLPCGFVPPNLVTIDTTAHVAAAGATNLAVRDFVQPHLQALLADARAATGDTAVVSSSYRSYATQVSVLNNESTSAGLGPCTAAREVAPPGRSEHQLGTALDLGVSGGRSGAGYLDGFGKTAAGAWIQQHAHEYGFVMSYPDARREAITGYRHEPWHFRYLGLKAAAVAYQNGWSVQEFFDHMHPRTVDLPMTCDACQASRGELSGCPTNTTHEWSCGSGPASGSRVRCELGLIQCEACNGGVCDGKPQGQDDVCRNGGVSTTSLGVADAGAPVTTPIVDAACPAHTYPIWTCSSDHATRVRCVNGAVETETCAAGCAGRPVGTDDVCL